jgi:hypothetical protein
MSFLIHMTVEIDSDSERVAERLFHELFELILDEPYVVGLAANKPIPGTIQAEEEGEVS